MVEFWKKALAKTPEQIPEILKKKVFGDIFVEILEGILKKSQEVL